MALRSRSLLVGSMSLAGFTSACNPSPPPVCGAPQGSSAETQSLAAADTAFAVSLYGSVTSRLGASKNVILSPYGVAGVLTMLEGGASGETALQMQRVLNLPGTAAVVAPAYAALACSDETQGSDAGNQLLIATSVWGQEGKSFQPGFLDLLSTGYAAPLQQVDFMGSTGAAASTINQWVSGQTQGQMPALLQPGDVTPETRLVLVDAEYFRGTWETSFDPHLTAPAPFMLSDGSMVQVETMSGTVTYAGGSLDANDANALSVYELPYLGGELALDVLMPARSLAAFEKGLTPDALRAALASLGTPSQRELQMPKFSFTTRMALAGVLAGMGMPDAFDPKRADLSGIDGQRDLSVTTVVQQAMVQVDEQGTVAAAATAGSAGVEVTIVAATPVINQPFLFLIRDTRNGSVLFMGRVEDPRQG